MESLHVRDGYMGNVNRHVTFTIYSII